MSTQQLTEIIENLSPEDRKLVEDFVDALSKRQERNITPPTFGREGGLVELRDQYTSVELQKEDNTIYVRLKHLSGVITDLPADLSTNPKYMEGFGLDRRQYEEMIASRHSKNKEDS